MLMRLSLCLNNQLLTPISNLGFLKYTCFMKKALSHFYLISVNSIEVKVLIICGNIQIFFFFQIFGNKFQIQWGATYLLILPHDYIMLIVELIYNVLFIK